METAAKNIKTWFFWWTMDKQKLASLLRERFEEQLGDDDVLWAQYERLAEERNCQYHPGSLCYLEMIAKYMKRKAPISLHVLKDEWAAIKLNEKGVLRAGVHTGQSLEGDQFLIEKWDYGSPIYNRKVRSVRAWVSCQFALIRGCLQPWIKERRNDPATRLAHPWELSARYFFSGMHWEDTPRMRVIQNSYFNVEKRAVFFRFRTPDRDEWPHPTLGYTDAH